MGDERTFRGPSFRPHTSWIRHRDDQEVAMLTEALGLLEWTAISASVATAAAALAVTLRGVLTRDR
jgi:hypothetical protein